jgi:hypothetical protein
MHHPRTAALLLWQKFWGSWPAVIAVSVSFLLAFARATNMVAPTASKIFFITANLILLRKLVICEELRGPESQRYPAATRSTIVAILLIIFVGVSYWEWGLVAPAPRPVVSASFPFILGAPLGDNDSPIWVMVMRHYGPGPAYNCDVSFWDSDRKNIEHDWLVKHPDSPFPPPGLARGDSQKTFHIPEADPLVAIGNFQWTPLDKNYQHYTVSINCRDGVFEEVWAVSRVDGVLRTEIGIQRPASVVGKNSTQERSVYTCTDPEFYSVPPLSTLPDASSQKVNPGWKPNHSFSFPVAIMDPNKNIEVNVVKEPGCWKCLVEHCPDAVMQTPN